MTAVHGKNGIVKIGADVVAEVRSFSLSITVQIADATAMGDTFMQRLEGIKDGSGSITCWFDPSDTAGQEAMTAGTNVTLLLYPEGDTSGDKEYSVPAIITEETLSAQYDSVVERTYSFELASDITISDVV